MSGAAPTDADRPTDAEGDGPGPPGRPGLLDDPFFSTAGDAALPPAARWGRRLALASVAGYVTLGTAAGVAGRVGGNAVLPRGGVWAAAALAAPGVAALALANYTIVRYPYLSLATAGGPRPVRTGRPLFVLLGAAVALAGVLLGAIVVGKPVGGGSFLLAFVAAEFLCVGWLLARYRPDRHPTVATLLTVTFGLAALALPLFLPALLVGSARLRRATRTKTETPAVPPGF